ncbi:MAG TPA: amino acid-binding ACT [Gemmataceae bacterium]|nr:amino acid-binding ACT [Gemmataceae bacterium]
MALSIRKVQVWTAELPDRPGAAAAKLELLARAGADLEFVFTRPHPRKPDHGLLYLAPITGPEQTAAARAAGLAPAVDMAMLCVEGANRPGIGCDIMSRLAVAGINSRGLSISSVGDRFAAYLAFDGPDSANLAVQVLAEMA